MTNIWNNSDSWLSMQLICNCRIELWEYEYPFIFTRIYYFRTQNVFILSHEHAYTQNKSNILPRDWQVLPDLTGHKMYPVCNLETSTRFFEQHAFQNLTTSMARFPFLTNVASHNTPSLKVPVGAHGTDEGPDLGCNDGSELGTELGIQINTSTHRQHMNTQHRPPPDKPKPSLPKHTSR